MAQDYTTSMIYGDDYAGGSMSPGSLSAGQAGSWADLLMTGLATAGANAAWNLSNTVGYQPQPMTGISIGTSGNLMPLLVLGALVYLVMK